MNATPEERSRLVLLTDDPRVDQLLRELLATVLPSVCLEISTPADAPLTHADGAIIDHLVRGLPGYTVAQELRARGFRGGLVILDPDPSPELERRMLTIAPARAVRRNDLVAAVPRSVVEIIEQTSCGSRLSAAERDLRRTQQLIAMGEVTSRIQHTLNNPLTALLAEAQLLEMEPLEAEQLASVRRIIDQCRRVVAMVRGLETKRSD